MPDDAETGGTSMIAMALIIGLGLYGQQVWARPAGDPDGWVRPLHWDETREAAAHIR